MTDAPANGKQQQAFPATELPPLFIDQINSVSIGPNIRMVLGNLTGLEDTFSWRQVIVIPDALAAGLLAMLTSQLMAKGVIASGTAENANEGETRDAQNRQRFN
jgi:hypothetical protein